MEAAILAAEEAVAEREAEVERAATAGHVALADACRALEEAQRDGRAALRPLAGTGSQTRCLTLLLRKKWLTKKLGAKI